VKSKSGRLSSYRKLEHLQADAVIDYLQMPERMRNVEFQVGAHRDKLVELAEALSRLGNLNSDEHSAEIGSQESKDYVF